MSAVLERIRILKLGPSFHVRIYKWVMASPVRINDRIIVPGYKYCV